MSKCVKNHLIKFVLWIIIKTINKKGETLMARRLNVVLEDELHTEIKILVAKKNITISQFVIEAVKEKLKKELSIKKE